MGYLFCPRCSEEKPVSEFHKNGGTKRGYHTYCKSCCKAYDKEKYPNGKPRKRARYYEQTYGLTLDELDSLFNEQGGVCAVCGCLPERPVVDHCHESGKVRGILCDTCNRCLGLLKDNPDILLAGAAYLIQHQPEKVSA